MAVPPEDRLVVKGDWGAVEYAVRSNDGMPAKDFIEELGAKDLRKVTALFQRLADQGQIRNREKFKKVEGKIFELKSFQIRIGCFQEHRTWFLTNGFWKKRDSWPTSKVKLAKDIREEHLDGMK